MSIAVRFPAALYVDKKRILWYHDKSRKSKGECPPFRRGTVKTMELRKHQFNRKGLLLRDLFLFVLSLLLFVSLISCAQDTPVNDTQSGDAAVTPASDQPDVSSAPTASPVIVTDAPATGSAFSPDPDPTPTALPSVEPTADPTDHPTDHPTEAPTAELEATEFEAIFLGIKGYGHINAAAVQAPGAKVYRFRVGSEEKLYSIRNTGGFPIQNQLMEGCSYRITVDGSEVTSAVLLSSINEASPVITGTPGKRTLKNFLKTSLMPLGSTLYVYGGGWDWQDEGSSVQATSIGVCGIWSDFFKSQNADYLYKDSQHPESSYYPFGDWNEYYYAGLDCSGYVGWVMYNTLETSSGRSGYVIKSSKMAKAFANEYGLGSWSSASFAGDLRPGDIISMNGHVWICIGKCGDGSIVIIHSSPSKSVTGCKGGGVQLSALNPNGDSKDCEAYRLAEHYQNKYFPAWASRYPAAVKSYDQYVNFDRTGSTGIFHWDLSGVLSDPDGYNSMSAAQVLADIFGE